jgi:hypothetical protein
VIVRRSVYGKRRAVLTAVGVRIVGPAARISSLVRLLWITLQRLAPALRRVTVRGWGLENDFGQQGQAADGRRPYTRQTQEGLEILGMLLVGVDEDALEPLLVDVQAKYPAGKRASADVSWGYSCLEVQVTLGFWPGSRSWRER